MYAFHIAITLRLSEPWFGSFRTLIADSAFASVETGEQLLRRGLYLEGCIKTATRRYPTKFFKALENDPKFKRGNHRVCKTTVKGMNKDNREEMIDHDMYAICWKDKVMKNFVGTCGSTTKGQDHVVERTRVYVDDDGFRKTARCDKHTDCPTFVNELFDGFNTVDVHDRYRQDILGLENHWETHRWWHRVFSTVLGVIVTDAYFMYRMDYIAVFGSDDEIESFEDWVGGLASELIFNHEDSILTRGHPLDEKEEVSKLSGNYLISYIIYAVS